MSRPPTNPNNDAKGISELVDEVAELMGLTKNTGEMAKHGYGWIDQHGHVWPTEQPALILKALHKAVMEALPKELDVVNEEDFTDIPHTLPDFYNLALKDYATTLNALLQPYKLRNRK